MKKQIQPLDQVFWYLDKPDVKICYQDMHADVAIIGGGMAGLSAAQAWLQRGKKVVLLEQWYCGAGASGKSSGFITPNAELSLSDFTHRYNAQVGKSIWDFILSGVHDIKSNIAQHNFVCDYQKQATAILALQQKDMQKLEQEYHTLQAAGYASKLYNQQDLQAMIGSKRYYGAVTYEDTFGIQGYQYCQQLKKLLQSQGAFIFEETPVLQMQEHLLFTPHAKITADYIVVCTDRFTPQLQLLEQQVYHVQTFLMTSQQLTDEQVQAIFPREKLMCWDTDFIYQYFRVTGDNRLLVGGSDVYATYQKNPSVGYQAIVEKLSRYCQETFPELCIEFEYMWPGMIGVSKDIAPIMGVDKDKPYIFYAVAATGLPIAAALGRYSAELLVDRNDEFAHYFSPYRKFAVQGWLQSIVGNKTAFMISHVLKKNMP